MAISFGKIDFHRNGESLLKLRFQNVPLDYQIVSDSFLKVESYLFLLGLGRLALASNAMRTNTIAITEKAVLSAAIPMVRNARPRIRKIIDGLRLFVFITTGYPISKI